MSKLQDETTVTFVKKSDSEEMIQLTIKSSFVRKYGNPDELGSFYDLMNNYDLKDYLHNAAGPAILYMNSGYEAYFINGKQLTGEDATKMRNDLKFFNKFDEIFKS